jgi:glycosyltransferase involved in cell wall biosynthesis
VKAISKKAKGEQHDGGSAEACEWRDCHDLLASGICFGRRDYCYGIYGCPGVRFVIFAFFKRSEKSRFSKCEGSGMDASILISTRNRSQYLAQTLDSLSRIHTDRLEVELIVIDNGSNDETAAVVTKAARRFPSRVHLLSFSRGAKAAALNHALPTATGRHLVFTDDDLRFDALWLLNLLAPLRAGQAEAVVGEVRLAPHLTRSWMEPAHRAMLAEVRPHSKYIGLVGANMALSRECFDWVGGFDPALGPGALGLSEEVLLERQIRAKGGRIQFVEGAVVEHHFDPKRLERSAWIQHAKASGRSDAYIFHHWHRGSMQLLALRRAKKVIQLGLCTLSHWRRRQAGSPIDSREIGLINYLAFLKQVAIQRGTDRKYSERCAESASVVNIHSNLRKRKSYRNAKLGFTPGP